MNASFTTYRGLLATYVRPFWRAVALMATLLLAAIAIDLISPQILRSFIDTAEQGGPQNALTEAALLFIGIALVGQLVRLGATYMSEQVGWNATNRLRADLLRHVIGLDLGFHKQNPPGALIERVDGDVTALANFFSSFVVTLVGNGLLMVGVLTLLWREDWRSGLGVTLYAFGTLVALQHVQRYGSGRWQAALQSEADLGGFLDERLRGTEDIRANGAEHYVLEQLDQKLRDQLAVLLPAFVARAMIYVSTYALFALGYALGLVLGAWLYLQGEATIGTAFLITVYVGLLAKPLEGIRGQIEDLQRASAGIARVNSLFALRSAVHENPRAMLPHGPLPLEFAGVRFHYDDEAAAASKLPTTVLHDATFTLCAGHVLGVLGRTGSGKTTLARLVFRLYDPQAGVIRLGGVDLRDLALSDLRQRIGMVTQDVQIYNASVRNNITLFNPAISDQTIWQVLETLELRSLFERLPNGLDTILGTGEAGLSAGEAQLLACARVFLRNPSIVLLDEASSRLDPATEALLDRAVARLLKGRTAIIIAHRLGTLRRADDILILDQGSIAEFGPRDMLAADSNSCFATLLRIGQEDVLA